MAPEIGPLALERTIEEGADPIVDLLAQLGDLALRDAGKPHRLNQLVNTPGRDTPDPRLLDHSDQCLLGCPAGFEEGREVAALTELRDLQRQRAQPRVERSFAVAVAPVEPFGRALVTAGADYAFNISFHQELENALGNSAQKVAFAALLQQLTQWQSVFGHRGVLGRDEVGNSTLTANRGDHPSSTFIGGG